MRRKRLEETNEEYLKDVGGEFPWKELVLASAILLLACCLMTVILLV